MSDRYQVIATLLDDPRNLAIVLRELYRREQFEKILITPPVKHDGVLLFLTADSYVSLWTKETYFEGLAEIEHSPDGNWYVKFSAVMPSMGDTSVGPFNSQKEAVSEAGKIFVSLGYPILEESPWDQDDLKNYPG